MLKFWVYLRCVITFSEFSFVLPNPTSSPRNQLVLGRISSAFFFWNPGKGQRRTRTGCTMGRRDIKTTSRRMRHRCEVTSSEKLAPSRAVAASCSGPPLSGLPPVLRPSGEFRPTQAVFVFLAVKIARHLASGEIPVTFAESAIISDPKTTSGLPPPSAVWRDRFNRMFMFLFLPAS